MLLRFDNICENDAMEEVDCCHNLAVGVDDTR